MNIQLVENKSFDLIAPLVAEVQNLHASLFPDVYKPFDDEGIRKAMEAIIDTAECTVFVAQSNGETVGYIVLLLKIVPENAFHYSQRVLHVDQLAVAGVHREKGVGSILMEKAEQLAQERSVRRIELDHLHINTVAATFFSRKGFVPYRNKLYKTITSNHL